MNAKMSGRRIVKLVREGALAADVEVQVLETGDALSPGPLLTPSEVRKLDAVRRALRAGDIKTASRLALRVYSLIPAATVE